CQQAYNTPLTF
nr:immunoglobulin light chain junction region [Macaca mulatta]